MKRVLILLILSITLQTVAVQPSKCVVSSSPKYKPSRGKDKPEVKCHNVTCTGLNEKERRKIVKWIKEQHLQPIVGKKTSLNIGKMTLYLWKNSACKASAANVRATDIFLTGLSDQDLVDLSRQARYIIKN